MSLRIMMNPAKAEPFLADWLLFNWEELKTEVTNDKTAGMITADGYSSRSRDDLESWVDYYVCTTEYRLSIVGVTERTIYSLDSELFDTYYNRYKLMKKLKEVADALEVSCGTVRSRVDEIRGNVWNEFREEGIFLENVAKFWERFKNVERRKERA